MESRLKPVNIHQITEKIGSKKELYDFLTQDCNAYLPKMTCTNVYFFKSIINGEKEYLRRSDVVVSAVPQIEGLTAEDFMDFAKDKPSILKFLPDQCDWLHLDKKWICDVLLSLDREGISSMINNAKRKRRDRLDNSQNLIVHMKPEFVQALQESINYSVHKGRSAHLLKGSAQRRRKQNELEEVKGEEKELKKSKQKYLEINKRMRQEFEGLKEQLDELNSYKELVHNLHSEGIIDDEGRAQRQSDLME